MNIHANPGTKIVFAHPTYGYPLEQEVAAKNLVEGDKYTVDYTEVQNWHTSVYIREVPGVAFNSVLFEEM